MRKTSPTTDIRSRPLPDLKWVNRVTRIMDSRFRIPGTNFRFGLDPILGLLPGLGDATSLAVSAMLIAYMFRYGASRKVMIMMAGNVMLDALVGSIPIIGNVFDFFHKANEKNIRLLREHYHEGKHQGSGTALLLVILLMFFTFIALILFGIWFIIRYLINL